MKPAVLIVEDDYIIQMFLDNVIRELGYINVGMCVSGEEALKLIEEKSPDLVLLDSGIRGNIDGIGVARAINEKYGMPFIFITGNTDKGTYERIAQTRPLGILKKPIDGGILKNELIRIARNLQTGMENGD